MDRKSRYKEFRNMFPYSEYYDGGEVNFVEKAWTVLLICSVKLFLFEKRNVYARPCTEE